MSEVEFKYKVPDVTMDISKLKSFGIQPKKIETLITEYLEK